jgi:ABC-type multidrug transport system permease subunit
LKEETVSNEENELALVERERLNFQKLVHARQRWWYEENLINQRLTWFFTSQGLLGLGFAWLKYRIAEIVAAPSLVAKPVLYVAQLEQLSRFLLALGLVVSVFTLMGIGAAISAQQLMKDEPENAGFRLDVSSMTTSRGRIAAYSIPGISIAAWLASFIFLQAGPV